MFDLNVIAYQYNKIDIILVISILGRNVAILIMNVLVIELIRIGLFLLDSSINMCFFEIIKIFDNKRFSHVRL